MLNDNKARILREDHKLRDVLYLIYSVDSGQLGDVNKPFYVTTATQKLHLSVREVGDNLGRLREMELIDNNGQTIRLREEAMRYIPDYLKKEFRH